MQAKLVNFLDRCDADYEEGCVVFKKKGGGGRYLYIKDCLPSIIT